MVDQEKGHGDQIRGGIKNTVFFLNFSEKGGGVAPNPQFPYQKKIRFFLIFFGKRGPLGGGVSPFPEEFYNKILIFLSNT